MRRIFDLCRGSFKSVSDLLFCAGVFLALSLGDILVVCTWILFSFFFLAFYADKDLRHCVGRPDPCWDLTIIFFQSRADLWWVSADLFLRSWSVFDLESRWLDLESR